MKGSKFFVLIAVTVLTLGLALFLSRPDTVDPENDQSQALVPGLKDQVNSIDRLRISSAADPAIELVRSDERWRVENAENYEADFELVYQLLRDLAAGERAEQRTSNSEWYQRLGVADVGSANPASEGADEAAASFEVAFPGTDLPSLIIGRAGPAGESRFVRLANEEQVWLSDRDISVPPGVLDWLQRSVMDIPASELAEITLRRADGEVVQLSPSDETGSQWLLMNVPDEREAEPSWRLNSVANALSNLQLEDVRRHEQAPEDANAALFVTRDGLNFVATLFEDEQGAWVNFSVSAEVSASAEDESMSDEAATSNADAAAVNARLSPWDFKLPSDKYQQMTNRLEDLLVDLESEAD